MLSVAGWLGNPARCTQHNGRWCCHQRPLCRAPPKRIWAVRSAPALTTSSAGAAAAGLAHFHGTFASASISALRGLLVRSAGPFRSTRSAMSVGLRLPPGLRVGAPARSWYPCPSPLRPCLRGTAHGRELAFQPLGCCPCLRARYDRVASGSGMLCGTPVPSANRPQSFLRGVASCARGALAGVSALAGGRFRRRSGPVLTRPTLSP